VAGHASELKPGHLVNGLYRLVRVLGVGGMGEVWEARHERTKGRVALKLLLTEMGRHEDVLLRFQREAEITSGLNHPNIVRVTDFDKLPDGRPFLAMEYLEGHDLSAVLSSGQLIPRTETIEIIEQVALGLHAAHGQSIIHRDLKPANIFMVRLPGTSRPMIKILDFGISKALDGINKLTQTKSLIGTPHYMAPEQATGGAASLDARADQFSLAAIAYELLTGRMAFDGDSMMNVLYKVVNIAPPSFASLDVQLPSGVEMAVMRGLSKMPKDRFGSVLELSDEIKRTASPVGGEPRPRAVPKVATRTSILPVVPASTTLRASSGEMQSARAHDGEVAGPVGGGRSSKRTIIASLIGAAVLMTAALAIVARRGAPVTTVPLAAPRPEPSPAATAPAAPAVTVPVSARVVPRLPAGEEPPQVKPVAPPLLRLVPGPQVTDVPTLRPVAASTQSKAQLKSTSKRSPGRPQASSQAPKPPSAKAAPHTGPLNDDL
jgi:serine/threonine protein kinase